MKFLSNVDKHREPVSSMSFSETVISNQIEKGTPLSINSSGCKSATIAPLVENLNLPFSGVPLPTNSSVYTSSHGTPSLGKSSFATPSSGARSVGKKAIVPENDEFAKKKDENDG